MNTRIAQCFAVCGAVLISAVATAQTPTTDSVYSLCLEQSGGVTANMRDCNAAEIARHDARLNAAYKALQAQQRHAAAQTRLRQAQRQWLKQRDERCAPDRNSGTAALLEMDGCYLNAIKQRANQLEAWVKTRKAF